MEQKNANHILIVDDNLKNLQVTAMALKEVDYLISLAQSGMAALEQLEQQTPTLLLIDVMMPEMTGFELCQRIKQIDRLKDIPVIFLTAKIQAEDLAEGFSAGGVDYITKPFNKLELLTRVKNHIDLANSKKEIVEMGKTRDKLYSIIAHDIRSPFAAIIQTIELIESGIIDKNGDTFEEIINDLKNDAIDTRTLLDTLLEWTKVQGESISINPDNINIHKVVNECTQLLKGNADSKEIVLKINVTEDSFAFCDEVTTHTIFRNLLSNAIKFTPENGIIEFKAETKDDVLCISVIDSGVGMPDDVIQKIFEKGEHYTSYGTNDEAGTGLGLTMVKDFVNKNKGEINVKSQINKGTEIIVKLPINQNNSD